jgi:excisionase family DNA binding protein
MMLSDDKSPNNNRILLRVPEAAQLLGLSRATLYALLAGDNQIPVVRIGRSVRIPLAGLQQWVDQRTEGWRGGSGTRLSQQ